jgi:hypothetical protein
VFGALNKHTRGFTTSICGASGYDVLDRSDEAGTVGSAGGNRGSFGAAYIQTHERSMLVACRVNKPAG